MIEQSRAAELDERRPGAHVPCDGSILHRRDVRLAVFSASSLSTCDSGALDIKDQTTVRYVPAEPAFLFAGWAIFTSILVLRRGRYYHSLKPMSRPRRWVLIALLWFLSCCWLIGLPVSIFWPDSMLFRLCTALFFFPFCIFVLVMRFGLDMVLDRYIQKRGLRLR